MPLPDAPWFGKSAKVVENQLAQAMQSTPLTGPDGQPMRLNGAAAFGGAQIKHVDLPPEVMADVNMAVALIRGALGPAPSPSRALHEALHRRAPDLSVQGI